MSPALRAMLADELAVCQEDGARVVGMRAGISKSAAFDRGTALERWPLADLLSLAEHYPGLRAALRSAVGCDVADTGSTAAAVRDGSAAVAAMGAAVAEVASDVADGVVSRVEARRARPVVRAAAAALTRLDRDLARIGGSARG